jgi:hypothetical protein
MARSRKAGRTGKNGQHGPAALGFEAPLWQAADQLASIMDAAEYKHVILWLTLLHLGCLRGVAGAILAVDGRQLGGDEDPRLHPRHAATEAAVGADLAEGGGARWLRWCEESLRAFIPL